MAGAVMRKFLYIALAFVLIAAGLIAWFAQDANRFKPALVALIEAETGIPVAILGDLSWRFRPRMWLAAEELYAVQDGRTWTLEQLLMRPDFGSLVRNPARLERWRAEEVIAGGLAIDDADQLVRVPRLRLRNIGRGNPAPLEARIVYGPHGAEPDEMTVAGVLTLDTGRASIRELVFEAPGAAGTCNLELIESDKLWPPLAPDEHAILPVDILRAFDWDGRCDLESIGSGGETFENVAVVLDNKEGGAIARIDAPTFLGGEAQVNLVVGVATSPVTWYLEFTLVGVDSGRLAAWLGGGGPMIATAVDFGGTMRMTGNTPEALAASMAADARLAGGPGKIDGGAIAQPVAEIARLLNSGGIAAGLPGTFDFESLSGIWTIDGERHSLDLELDDLRLDVEGDYRVADDQLDLRGAVQPGQTVARWIPQLGESLAGAPVHFRCQGPAASPECRLDARRTLIGVGTAEGGAVARQLIDRHVPEEYRDAARSLLDMLSGTREEN